MTVYAGDPTSWFSRRQQIVALSTTEAEFVAATDATKETFWMCRLFKSLGINIRDPPRFALTIREQLSS